MLAGGGGVSICTHIGIIPKERIDQLLHPGLSPALTGASMSIEPLALMKVKQPHTQALSA